MDSQQRGIFIVAIRGSSTKVDYIVNLDNAATEIEDFIVCAYLADYGALYEQQIKLITDCPSH